MKMDTLARTGLAVLPTPLLAAPRLSEEVGLEIWLKRDDLTGFGLGGNKVRALEFLIGAAEAEGADCFVTGGGPASNWVMLAALAAITRGMQAHIVYFGPPVEPTGNHLLVDRLPGVEITFTGNPDRGSVDPALGTLVSRLTAAGRRPYLVGRGGAGPVGALGYLTATAEIDLQLETAGIDAESLWLATGSCGTQAGLVAGHAVSTHRRRIVGVSVHRPVAECRARIGTIAEEALDLVGAQRRQDIAWEVLGGQLDRSPGLQAKVRAASDLTANTEGVFLDPEFGAPAMAELIGRSKEMQGPVVFLVTGGAPALFTRTAFE